MPIPHSARKALKESKSRRKQPFVGLMPLEWRGLLSGTEGAGVESVNPEVIAGLGVLAAAGPSSESNSVTGLSVVSAPAVSASTAFVPGQLGNAISFNASAGSNIYADMGDPADGHLDLGANATIEAWVRFDSVPTNAATIVSKDEGGGSTNKWIFAQNSSATVLHINSPGSNGGVWLSSTSWTPTVGQWYHLAVVKAGNSYTFYRDGIANGNVTSSIPVPDVNAGLILGQAEGGFKLNGSLDDVRIWNTARTAPQILSSKGTQLIGTESNLVGYWQMNENSGGSIADTSPFHTSGTVRGVPGSLTFVQSPVGVTVGSVIRPAIWVALKDTSGFFLTSGSQSVTLSIISGPGSLGGTLTVTAVNGVATFSNVSLSAVGTYSLRASASGLSDATSSTFVVAATPNVFVPGKLGNGMSFDALSNSNIDADMGNPADGHLDLGGNATIEAWVKFDSLPSNSLATIASKDEGGGNTNKWIFAYANNYGVSNATVLHFNTSSGGGIFLASNPWIPVIGQWYHLAVVKSGSSYTFYRDGVADGTGTNSTTIPVVNASLKLGQAEGAFWLRGALDDVRIWNIARTQTQIQGARNTELAGGEAGLIGYWRLNESSGTNIADLSTYHTNGTVKGTSGLEVPALSSLPGASATIYLNFMGDYIPEWGQGHPGITPAYDADGIATSFNSWELDSVKEIWARVSELFSPFNVNVTTINPVTFGAGQAERVNIGGDGLWIGSPGGIAGVGAFNNANNVLWVFSDNYGDDPHNVALCVAHEAGHSFGLWHNGPAPDVERGAIMGAPWISARAMWWNGVTPLVDGPSVPQDDLAILSGANSGIQYRTVPSNGSKTTATPLTAINGSISAAGTLSRTSDLAYYSFQIPAGNFTLTVERSIYSGMLDATLELRDSAGNLLVRRDTASLGETLTMTLAAGTYYAVVGSHGGYGDIGQYTLTGSLNLAPTDLTLSAAQIAEGLPVGTTVGTFSTSDPNPGDTFTYTLVTGTGGTDNASFTIDAAGNLKSAATFSFVTKSSYSIRVRTTDQGGLSFEKQFTITVAAVNAAPTNITLPSTQIAEGVPIGTTIGMFATTDANPGDTFIYTLVTGAGSTDNASFTIDPAGNLKSAAVFSFSTKSSYSIRVRSTDQGGLSFEKQFTIAITSVNVSPTNIALSSTQIVEGQPVGTTIGTFTTSDLNVGNTFTYALVTGTGSSDNASFTIDVAGNLKSAAIFSFLTKSSYAIRVRSTDQGGFSFEKQFTIAIVNSVTNVAPTNVSLSSLQILEGLPTGTTVGMFTTTDPNPGNTFTYALVSGVGSTDNSSFSIDAAGSLKSAAIFNFSTKSSYTIRVRSTDQGGLSFEKQLTISVVSSVINLAPTNIALSSGQILEGLPIGTTIGALTSTDPNPGNTFTYALVSGAGSSDNASFTIDGLGNLKSAVVFVAASKTICFIRIRSTDQGGLWFEKQFAVVITSVNAAPTDIFLTSTEIAEGLSAGTTVGFFTSVDPNVSNAFTYDLISGAGSDDNGSFTIDSFGNLKSASVFSFAGKTSYAIRVRSTDQGGLFFEKQFTIAVVSVNLAPVDITLSSAQITEGQPVGTRVGVFGTVDPNPGNTFIYSLIPSVGGDDNDSFTIDAQGVLRSASVFSFAIKQSFAVRVRSTDQGGLSIEKQFAILLSVNQQPSFIAANPPIVDEDPGMVAIQNWALFDPGSDREREQAATYHVTLVSNASLFAIAPSVTSDGMLSFTPAPNAFGTSTFRVTVSDSGGTGGGGVDTSAAQTFSITVTSTNDQPSFAASNPPAVDEDSPLVTVNSWAEFIPGGGDDENTQAATYFVADISDVTFFDAVPSVTPAGTLTYKLAANAFGTATFSLAVRDNGGTANGGVDTSITQTFTVSVNAINDPPTLIATDPPSSFEDAGPVTIAQWATFNPGEGEGTQSATYRLSSLTNAELFAATPTVDLEGTLRYTASANVFGTATFTLAVQDDGGTVKGGVDFSAPKTFTITITPVNDRPSFTALDPSAINEDSGAVVVPNWATFHPGGGSDEASQTAVYHVSNLTNPHFFETLPSVSPDGTLTYAPAPNASGIATFSLTVADNGGFANGGVDTSVSHLITVTISAVNDAPSFQKGPDIVFDPAMIAVTQNQWATQISPGPGNESSQHAAFILSGYDTTLFSVQPAIDAITGQLTFFSASQRIFKTTVTVTLVDDGGTLNGGADSSAQTFTISQTAQFGTIRKTNVKAVVVDEDGTAGTLTLKGGGVATIARNSLGGLTLSIVGANAKSALKIIANKGGDGVFDLAGIVIEDETGSESLGKIDAGSTHLHGDLRVAGTLASLTLGDVGPGTFTIGPSTTAVTSVTMALAKVTDLSINSATPIKSLSTIDWNDSDSTADVIATPWIGKVTIAGSRTDATLGGFEADLVLSGEGAAGGSSLASFAAKNVVGSNWKIVGTVGSITVGGTIGTSELRVTGNIGAVTANSIVDSLLFAGVADSVTGLPVTLGDFAGASSIASLTVKGTGSASFVRSNVAARVLPKISLKVIDPTNGGHSFGFAADNIKKYSRAGLTPSLKNLDAANPNNDPALGGDFVLRSV